MYVDEGLGGRKVAVREAVLLLNTRPRLLLLLPLLVVLQAAPTIYFY